MLVLSEQTIRDMQLTKEVKMTKRSLIRWIALSLGLINRKESRRAVLDVLEAIFYFQFAKKQDPTTKDIIDYISKLSNGTKEKSIRYHMSELVKKGIIQRTKRTYHFAIPLMSEKGDIVASLEQSYISNVQRAFEKVKEAVVDLKTMFESRD